MKFVAYNENLKGNFKIPTNEATFMDIHRYAIEISIVGTEPKIWRYFTVPANISLDRLQDVIQIIMGWPCAYPYHFLVGKKKYTESPESQDDSLEAKKYRLGNLIKKKGREFEYLYWYYDWRHRLVLWDDFFVGEHLHMAVQCLDGDRACPPEEVVEGRDYKEFCNILNNPDHADYEEIRGSVDDDYDAGKFDIYAINRKLSEYLYWSRDRSLKWKVPLFMP